MNKPVSSVPSKLSENLDGEVRSLNHDKKQNERSHAWVYYIRYVVAGIFFGILLVKSEVISWFRIQEMFRFQSFHMYGVIGSAVVTGIISLLIMKKLKVKTIHGETIMYPVRQFSKGTIYGGLLFGFGWALTGACPGPLYAQIGTGAVVITVTLASALTGTWVYGRLREKLPH
ncbi:MAG TPA: DUF6691 family protein [Ohtaekwangia sp.]|uniref:DUF6691 family protein n=1 Tax=Ohtaekwangia sp. TaxID=2066019 RepID=UPI002F946CC5